MAFGEKWKLQLKLYHVMINQRIAQGAFMVVMVAMRDI
jgi:hypothetical protein